MPLSPISVARLAQVNPTLAARVRALDAALPDLNIQVTQGLRTWSVQDALYAQGRTKPGPIVTDAPGGHSWHEYGLAVDIVPEEIAPGQPDWNLQHPAWQRIIAAAPTVQLFEGNKFPGRLCDTPHLEPDEVPLAPTDADRQDFKDAGMQAVWEEYLPTPLGGAPAAAPAPSSPPASSGG